MEKPREILKSVRYQVSYFEGDEIGHAVEKLVKVNELRRPEVTAISEQNRPTPPLKIKSVQVWGDSGCGTLEAILAGDDERGLKYELVWRHSSRKPMLRRDSPVGGKLYEECNVLVLNIKSLGIIKPVSQDSNDNPS